MTQDSGGEPAMTQVTSAHLGESLGTDFFSVREQFTDEQWSHFITVRRSARIRVPGTMPGRPLRQ
jgi:hypothetical protein